MVGRASCWVPRRVKGRRGADTCGLRGGGEGEGEVPGGFRGRDWGFEAVLGDSGGWGGWWVLIKFRILWSGGRAERVIG